MIPIVLVLSYFDIGKNEIGEINYEKYSFIRLFLSVVIIAPILETLLMQTLPIKIIQRIFSKKANLLSIIISSVIFSLAHSVYSIWYSLLIFPLGFLLAKAYIIFQERKESSFWITFFIHFSRNLIGVISIFISGKLN